MLRNGELKFWTPVNFEAEYFISEETEDVLTDTVIYLSDQHLTWLSQLKPNAKVAQGQATLCVQSAQYRTRSSDIALLRSLKQCSADREYTY